MVSPRFCRGEIISGCRRRNISGNGILDDGRTGLFFREPGHRLPSSFSFLPPLFFFSSVGATKLYLQGTYEQQSAPDLLVYTDNTQDDWDLNGLNI
jgi:hypothetical protein